MEAETTAVRLSDPAGAAPTGGQHDRAGDSAQPRRKKQKRNKPTLSCEECVERKTKVRAPITLRHAPIAVDRDGGGSRWISLSRVALDALSMRFRCHGRLAHHRQCDRGRPQCLACIKRQSDCRYSEVANLIASADRNATRPPVTKSRKQSKPAAGEDQNATIPPRIPTPRPVYRSASLSSTGSSSFLLSNIPYSNHAPSLFFGLGSGHPFANYWTNQGGLPEVIGVLPSKDQADILVAKYFEAVDPVYPMIHRRNFYADYERFWSLSLPEKQVADPVLLALHFVVYAMGTQFIQTPSEQERAQIAEFYVSASHQALRLSSYLSRTSLRTIQAMVLVCYFLMNDNHASDAWAFGGVLMRQAYAMGLNRDPDIISQRCSQSDKQQRRKVWQAVLLQDTFLTVLLKLPPTATFSDVRVDSLTDDLTTLPPGNSINNLSILNNPNNNSGIG
ncbi:hypothetical protein AOQ84DRAFT_382675, partial [Glonium stellatum]